MFVDHAQEIYISRYLSKVDGLGPAILLEFEGGRIEQFLEGRTLEFTGKVDFFIV